MKRLTVLNRYLLKRGDNINVYEEGTITEILNIYNIDREYISEAPI